MSKREEDRALPFSVADLARFIDKEPGEGFLAWAEASAEGMVNATTPEQRTFARILRAVVTATIESANAAVKYDGADAFTTATLLPRCAMYASVGAMISCFKEETPTAFLRNLVIEELDFVLSLLAPGPTIGGPTEA